MTGQVVLAIAVSVALGATIASAIFYLVFFSNRKNEEAGAQQQLEDQRRLGELQTEAKLAREQKEKAEAEAVGLRERVVNLEKALAAEGAAREQFEKSKLQLTKELENLANKILRDSQKQLQETSEKGLQSVLGPLKEKLGEFKAKVEEVYSAETRERLLLKTELDRIVAANQQMSVEASNLTKALKGDSKAQGDWGEMKLELLLESSGLRKDEEYIVQGVALDLRDEDGRIQKPDVVVRLPDEKHLIIDSKVSLPAFVQFVSAETEETRALALKDLHKSVYKHVDGLAEKHYAAHGKLRSPEQVLMFLPTEAMAIAVISTDKDLFTYAANKGVILVGPTLLLPILKTVASVWKSERQNKNALLIAQHAGLLYDRFVALTKSLDDVGKALTSAQKSYAEAVHQIDDPSRGISRKIEDLRDLGAKTKKKLDAKHLGEDAEGAPERLPGELPLPALPKPPKDLSAN